MSDALRIVVEDPVVPFTAEDAESVGWQGVSFNWPFCDSPHLIELFIPFDICDGKIVNALRDRGHKNIKRRRNI